MNNDVAIAYGLGSLKALISFIEVYSLTGSFKTLLNEMVYFRNGKFHREDGPAIEFANGNKFWYINDKLHREDGPACEYANGDKSWYINGQCHRENGPAIEFANGDKSWYINGKKLNEAEFNARKKVK